MFPPYLRRFREYLRRLLEPRAGVSNDPAALRIEELIGEPVSDASVYLRALRHRSVLRSSADSMSSNERLEFLGDAVLGAVVAEHLYLHYYEADEGFLTRLRSKLVNGSSLARCAANIKLGEYLEISQNMDRGEGRTNKSILADAYEAIIGAIYLDKGMDSARRFVLRTLLDETDLETVALTRDNYKSMLLEFCQAQSWPQPSYEIVNEEGPDHDKRFTVSVLVNNRKAGVGMASSKKSAEQLAARSALEALDQASTTARSGLPE